jgi:hypothetical protein
MKTVLGTVPSRDGEAEARSADLDVLPATDSFGLKRSEHARAAGDQLPAAAVLLADERIGSARIPVAERAALGDDRFGQVIAVEVDDLLDRARRVAGRARVLASAPLSAGSREARGAEGGGLVGGRQG